MRRSRFGAGLLLLAAACLAPDSFAAAAASPDDHPDAETLDAYTRKLRDAADRLYHEQRQNLEQARERLQVALERQGDWEYRVVDVPAAEEAQLEPRLNALGAERWQCFEVQATDAGWKLFLKRPVPTDLDQIPTEELMRILPLLLINH
ncbi:MAG: hypothetical protein E1N59_2049 [Puniceicoccaceae bacterium 5H]|nr:MAG: hypothetical protein E1N59_2049 [Puniceicoccaceae bacterium 5H]